MARPPRGPARYTVVMEKMALVLFVSGIGAFCIAAYLMREARSV